MEDALHIGTSSAQLPRTDQDLASVTIPGDTDSTHPGLLASEEEFPMGKFSRCRFLVTASTVAGTLSMGKRFGWAKPEKSEPDNLKLWMGQASAVH
jgi:hypothetical protein